VDTDIRKPDTGNVNIDRPTSTHNTDATTTPDHIHSPSSGRAIYAEPVSEGEEDEDMAGGIARDEIGSARVPLGEALEAIAWREKQLRSREAQMEAEVARHREAAGASTHSDDESNARRPFLKKKRAQMQPPVERLSIDPLVPASVFDKSLQKKLDAKPEFKQPDEGGEGGDTTVGQSSRMTEADPEYIRNFVASPGKRIAVPVRIEPKVFFAQERTFLVGDTVVALMDTSESIY